MKKDVLPFTYAISLAGNDDRILNYIEKIKWDVTLGNDWDNALYQDAYFKDLRVWSSVRTVTDLYTYRLRQVPITDDLEVNLKLMDGSPMVPNYSSVRYRSQLDHALATGATFVESDGDNLVCSEEMFFNFEEKKCTGFPFTTDIPIVYRVVNSV